MKASTVVAFGSSSPAMLRQHRHVRVAAAAAPHRRGRPAAQACQQQPKEQQQQQQVAASRRSVLALPAGLAAAAALATLPARPAAALVIPPSGYRYHEDKLDGYSFFYPEDWQPVTVSHRSTSTQAGEADAGTRPTDTSIACATTARPAPPRPTCPWRALNPPPHQ